MNYYNEFDPKAAAWLRELIRQKQIPEGFVDERSICEVQPTDLVGFTQVHLFSGIAGWPLALSLAGVSPDEPIWTGSCPCPPFSCAGKKKSCPRCGGLSLLPHPFQTGVFACCECGHEWFADARHLWPEFYRLIRQCRPATVYGEQVAGKDGEIWLAGVRACLEIERYGFGSSDLCSAGVGAPNIRQRLFWVADSENADRGSGHSGSGVDGAHGVAESAGEQTHASVEGGLHTESGGRSDQGTVGLPDAQGGGCGELRSSEESRRGGHSDSSSGLGQPNGNGCESWREESTHHGARHWDSVEPAGGPGVRMGEPIRTGLEGHAGDGENRSEPGRHDQDARRSTSAAGSLGMWGRFDICNFTDGKTRRIEPGTFPLAPRLPGHLVQLRGYGNAINPWVAKEFILAHREAVQAIKSKHSFLK